MEFRPDQTFLGNLTRKAGLFVSSIMLLPTMLSWICGYGSVMIRDVRWGASAHGREH